MKVFDSEIKLMEIIWRDEPVSAKAVSLAAEKEIGWNKNTRGEIQKSEARGLLDRFFSGSRKALFSALLEDEELSDDELAELRELIDRR